MTDMLKYLKIVDKVHKPVMINEAASLSINASGDNANDVSEMISKIMNLSGMKPVSNDMMPQTGSNLPMVKTIADVGKYADSAAAKYADDVGEELSGGFDQTDTEMDPEITNDPGEVTDVTMKTSGGLNRPKAQFKKEYPGDNPMAVKEGLADRLMAEYKSLVEGNPANKAKKDAAVSAIGSKNREKHYLTRMNPNQADKIRGREVTQGKDRKWHGTDNQDRMDELSPDTKNSYIRKADKQVTRTNTMGVAKRTGGVGMDDASRKMANRKAGIKRAMGEATDPRDSRPQTYRPNDTTPYSRDRLATRMSSDPKDSKPRKAGKLLGLKSSIKDALGKHGPKGHLPEATNKKPTDDAKKKSEKMKAYRADRDKHGED
jgi:hypothetical protein